MEELCYPWHFHAHHDIGIRFDHLWRPIGTHDNDTFGASEVFRRDHFDWLSGVSNSWFAMVSKPLLVLFAHVQLLFVWRKSSGLFRCGDKSCRISALFGCVPSLFIVCIVLHWIRLVCTVARQKVLFEAV